MKTCSTCHEGKSASEFGKNKRRADGLHYSCRSCAKVAQAATFQRHKVKRMAAAAEWARNNPEARRAIVRRYRDNPRVLQREASRMKVRRASRPDVREQCATYSQEWRDTNPDRLAYQRVKITIAHQTGLRYRDVPDSLAEAKVAQVRVTRAVREARKA